MNVACANLLCGRDYLNGQVNIQNNRLCSASYVAVTKEVLLVLEYGVLLMWEE
jgi:hypothetical protein